MSTSTLDKAVACWIPGTIYGLCGAFDWLWDGTLSPEGVSVLMFAALLVVIPAALLLAVINEDRRWRRKHRDDVTVVDGSDVK
jgi:hypothetical protein